MKASASQVALAWYQSLQAAEASQWDTISQRFLEHLHSNGALKQLSEIQRRITDLEKKANGVTDVIVRSAHARSEEEVLPLITQVLGEGNVEITMLIDESLVGGIQIETRNKRFDLSLRGELRQLKKTLT